MAERLNQWIRFLFYVLIFWMPYSAAVIECCVILSLGLWIVKRTIAFRMDLNPESKSIAQRLFCHFKPVSSPLNRPIGYFLIFCLVSSVSSDMSLHALKGFITKTLEWFVIYFLVIEVFRERKQIFTAIGVLIFTVLGTAVDSFIQYYFTHKDIFNGRVIEAGGRATAGFKAPSGLGGLYTIIIPLVGALVWQGSKSRTYRGVLFVLLSIMCWSMVLSFSRGAILGILAACLFSMFVLFYFCFKHKIKAYAVFTLTALMIIGVSQISLSEDARFGFLSRGTSNFRLIIWEGAAKMIREKPWFGHGTNTFMEKFQNYRRKNLSHYKHFMVYSLDQPTYSHNCYLQIWAETGIFSLIAFLWVLRNLYVESIRRISECYRQDHEMFLMSLGLLSGLFAFLTQSFFDTNFYSLQLSAYFWYMAGLQMALNHISTNIDEGIQHATA